MKLTIPALALLTLALSACNDRAPTTDDAATPPVVDQPAEDMPPATAPTPPATDPMQPATPPVADAGDSRFDGYGDMRFGMSAEEAKKAWGGELNGAPGAGEVCYFLSPKWVKTPAEFAFMVENDKFVRYSTESSKFVAPGGGKIGMTADEIKQLYSGRVEEQNHKYEQGGKYLRVKDTAGSGVVLFETNAAGTVDEWRVGVPPQVDYVEGCS
ncbi:MAG: lectin [Lysobacter sp.]|nr:lectin [Lysobacter sp.]